VLKSGWLTTGPKSAELERLFCERLGCEHAVCVSSATAAMHLLLHAMGVGPGDEVITPSMTWVSTVNLITLCGARPIFVDVDKDTLMTTAELIEPLITERTRMIVPVHYAGSVLNMKAIRSLAVKHDIVVVEDAAHALGSLFDGEPIGGTGTSIFSLHPIKNITTGEGGVLCTSDTELATRIRQLRFHGLGVDAFDRETHGRAPQAEVLEPGFKQNLPDMNAALGISQLKRLDSFNTKRASLAMRYQKRLEEIPQLLPLAMPDHAMTHSWHLFIVRLVDVRAELDRDRFMAALKERGIGTGLHFRAVHDQKYYREKLPQAANSLPNTEWNSDRILSLPLFPDMTESDQDRVIDAIKSVFHQSGF
jgi:UDP-4-amino-4-deoxy-L-arabinose-oxoglutarate aminotransferase